MAVRILSRIKLRRFMCIAKADTVKEVRLFMDNEPTSSEGSQFL